jgi:thymidylate kinase
LQRTRQQPRAAELHPFGFRERSLGYKSKSMKTKLILVEGLPGSGKSTIAQFIWMQLQKHGVPCRWYYEEEEPHPVAFYERSSVHSTATDVFSDALAKWQSFVSKAQQSDAISIIESHLFQDPIFSLLMEDIERPQILAFIHEIKEVCRCLDPVLFYFFQSDYAQTLRRICTHRGQLIERFYITRVEQSVFGQRRGLHGFAGLVQFWEAVKEIAERLFMEFDIPKLAIENSAGTWSKYYGQICDFLALPWRVEPAPAEQYLRRFVGTYTCLHRDTVREFTIHMANGHLVIRGFPRLWPEDRLIPKADNVFYVASWPFTIIFQADAGGVIQSMRKETQAGAWEKLDQVCPKIR